MRTTRLHAAVCCLALTLALAWLRPAPLAAQEGGWGEEGQVYAIQKKPYRLKHELHAAVGTLPMDAFYKGVTLGGGYTYHFTHHFAWEVFQILYSQNVDTGLKKDLEDQFAVEASSFREVDLLANTNVVFTPLYGKVTWLNRKVIRMEVSVTAGGGVARYTEFEREGASGFSEDTQYKLSANFGMGLRVFMNQRFSLRLDMRDYMNFVDGVDNVAYFGLGLGWNFRLPRFADQEEDAEP
ncbi:MAG: outer membrane beta-barrel domain-containing protein [bacterium]